MRMKFPDFSPAANGGLGQGLEQERRAQSQGMVSSSCGQAGDRPGVGSENGGREISERLVTGSPILGL